MSFTFDPSLSAPLDRVRQTLGDTDVTNAEFQNETIAYYLKVLPSELACAYRLALDASAKYARLVDIAVDHQLTKASQAAEAYSKLAERILGMMARENAASPGTSFVGLAALGVGTGPTEGYAGFDYPGLPPICSPFPPWPPCGC